MYPEALYWECNFVNGLLLFQMVFTLLYQYDLNFLLRQQHPMACQNNEMSKKSKLSPFGLKSI